MVSEKLLLAVNEAKQKADFTEITDEWLVTLVQSALAFENPSLTKEEVAKVLKGDTLKVNSDKVQAITNQKNAFLKMLSMVKEGKKMDENAIKDLHQILAEGLQNVGGLYRNVNISIKGSNHTPCSWEKVYDRMEKYINYLEFDSKKNLWEYISYSHLQLAKIHPFVDFNGRLARLVLNYELLSNGFMPVIITEVEREDYLKALEAFKVEKDIKPFMDFLEELELKSLATL